MENQAKAKTVNRLGISFVILTVLMAWILDVFSTWMGLSFFGLYEANPIFLTYPYVWLIVVEAVAVLIYFFKWAPVWMRKTLLGVLMIGSFFPACMNMLTALRVAL